MTVSLSETDGGHVATAVARYRAERLLSRNNRAPVRTPVRY